MIYRKESKKMIAYEKLIQKHFDHCTVISHADAQLLELDSRSPFSILENGVYVEEINEGLIEKKYDISFIGNMGYLPNIEAAISLAKEIIPALDPHVRLLIAGARPEASVKALANDSRVTVTGWVDDIRIAYLSSKVFVAPLYSGTGQQNKILEAMSLGIPCITTPQVNRSIGARPDEEILIAENNIQFIQILKKVLNDTERLNRISSNAYTFVKKRFSWEQKGIQLSSIIDKIHNNTTS